MATPHSNNTPPTPDDERLLAYTEGRLSPEEAQALEEELMESVAGADALEGLQGWEGGEAAAAKARISRRLQAELSRHKGRRRRRGMADNRWYYAAVIVILLLAAICWYLMLKMKG